MKKMDALSLIAEHLRQAVGGNEAWQFGAAILIALGIALFFEAARKRGFRRLFEVFPGKRSSRLLSFLQDFMPAVRLIVLVLALRVAETPLTITSNLSIIFGGIELFLLILAALCFLFQVLNLVQRLHENISAHDRKSYARIRRAAAFLRVLGTAAIVVIFLFKWKEIIPSWLWHNGWFRLLVLGAVVSVVIALGHVAEAFFSSINTLLSVHESKTRFRLMLSAARVPAYCLLAMGAARAAAALLPLPADMHYLSARIIDMLGVLAVFFFAYRLLDLLEHELGRYAARDDNRLDNAAVHLVRNVGRVLVIAFGVIYLLQAATGKPMNTLIAGLGIGGLAVALAAQDTLKNLFGSFMIMLDKPFVVGDRIIVNGCDGIVEKIGFRSTRIRTFTGHQVSVPNERVASVDIENIGRRPSIRRLTNITVTYDTPPGKVERALDIIREILANHEGMHPDYPPRVYFNEFNDTSLNIIMIYWYHPPDYWNFMAFSERVNLEIMRSFEKEGIEFAFPTSTAYLAHDPRRPLSIAIRNISRTEGEDASSKQ
ncbi:MAG: mechanosensitive ion channel family protein [Deltaproteobacteria bacterium]|nr:mechanosensitive ion channel family protein [Deltaproteobacteria bacterium]